MKPFTHKHMIYGNWATLLLPIQNDDSIDYNLLEDEIDYMVECGVDGIYSNGTAGEFYTQSREEFLYINSILSYKCNNAGIPFQIGASHMSPQESLFRIRSTKGMCPSAFQIILPDWFPSNMVTAMNFLENISEATEGIPLVIYNPPHAKRVLQVHDWVELLKQNPNILGVKIADGDTDWYTSMSEVIENVSVFVPGHHLATGMAHGALGSYSNMACLTPKGSQRWTEIIKSDSSKGISIENRISEFMNECIVPFLSMGYSNQACDKFLAAAGDWLPGLTSRIRLPYASIPQEHASEIGKKARTYLPEFFYE